MAAARTPFLFFVDPYADGAGEGANELIQMGSILVQSRSSLEEVSEIYYLEGGQRITLSAEDRECFGSSLILRVAGPSAL